MSSYTRTFVAEPQHIDELGHVNNTVWVQWIQDMAVGHWESLATPEQQAAYIWVVTRHEIDYRGNVTAGQTVTAKTWLNEPPRGARFDRYVSFTGVDGKLRVEAKSTWALIDRASGRLLRVPADLAAPFLG